MIRWFFDIPSKLIHWRLNLVRTLGAYVPWLRRDDGSIDVYKRQQPGRKFASPAISGFMNWDDAWESCCLVRMGGLATERLP